MKRRSTRASLGLLLALLVAAPRAAHAFGNWKSAISFGVASSWTSATGGYSGAVQGMYSTAGGPVWHFASGAEASMLSGSPAPGTVYTQAFSTTPTFTSSNGHTQLITLTGNVSSWSMVAGQPGDILTLIFVQDSTGSRTLSGTPSNVTLAGSLTLSTAANARDSLTLRYDSISGLWQEIGRGLSTGSGGGGGGSTNLRLSYAAGASQTDSTMTLDSTRLGLQIIDAASPINGGLFTIANSGSTTTFFQITDNGGQQIKSAASSGNNALTLDTTTGWTGGSLLRILSGGSNRYLFQPFGLNMTPVAVSGGTSNAFILTGAANTALTASSEVPDVNINLARTVQWSTGALTTQRFFRLQPPTMSFVGASTVTNAYTLAVEGAPKAGTNATLTNTSALGVFTGADAAYGITMVPNSSTQSGAMWRSMDASGNVLASLTMTDAGQSNRLNLSSQLNGGYNFLVASTVTGAINMQANGGILLTYGAASDYRWLDSGGSNLLGAINSSGVSSPVAGLFHHIGGSGTSPTKAAGACLGGTQTVTLDAGATDAAGLITLASTATGSATSVCATVTFNTSYTTQPHCQIAPANQNAAALSGAAQLWVDYASSGTSTFVIKSNTALVAGTYAYTYDCTQ